jgi:hypothetical protein
VKQKVNLALPVFYLTKDITIRFDENPLYSSSDMILSFCFEMNKSITNIISECVCVSNSMVIYFCSQQAQILE